MCIKVGMKEPRCCLKDGMCPLHIVVMISVDNYDGNSKESLSSIIYETIQSVYQLLLYINVYSKIPVHEYLVTCQSGHNQILHHQKDDYAFHYTITLMLFS